MNGVAQSGGEFEYMWKKVIDRIKKEKLNTCLVLGVGGGTAFNYLKQKYRNVFITGVELDPVIIDVQKKYFSIEKESNINLICEDAFKWVDKYLNKSKFDLIIVDLYHNRLNPLMARNKEFMGKIKKLLSENGFVIFNAHFQPEKPEELDEFLKICEGIFSTQEIVFSYKYNRMVLLGT